MATLIRIFLAFWVVACANPRPTQPVIEKANRLAKKDLQGEYLFLKSVAQVSSPGEKFRSYMPALQLEASQIVHFEIRENHIDVLSSDPIRDPETGREKNRLLGSFQSSTLDILPKPNADGEDTHIEEETSIRKRWQDREFLLVDWATDSLDKFPEKVQRSVVTSPWETDPRSGVRGIEVEKTFEDGTSLRIRYQFKPWSKPSMELMPYPLEEQLRFGFFKKTVFGESTGILTRSEKKDYLVRWDVSKPIVFHVSANFPKEWTEELLIAVDEWRSAYHQSLGDTVIDLVWGDSSTPGDLSKNQILYDETSSDMHGLLGYAPIVWDPRNGQIVKADIVLYGKALQRALFFEKVGITSPEVAKEPKLSSVFSFEKLAEEPSVALNPLAVLPLNFEATENASSPNCHFSMASMPWHDPHLHPHADSSPEAKKQAFQRIRSHLILGLLLHEAGHAMAGLTHNFLGSADARYYTRDMQSSTVMDYYPHPHSFPRLGPYDKASIDYAYSPNLKKRQNALKKNLFFCSERDKSLNRFSLCQSFDKGSTLTEMVQKQEKTYFSSLLRLHARLDQAIFPRSTSEYDQLLSVLLTPLRTAYDSAEAILNAADRRDYEKLWSIAGQRIEADNCDTNLDDKNCFETEIHPRGDELFTWGWDGLNSSRLKRYLDHKKIRKIANDAKNAKEEVIEVLWRILQFSDFPDQDISDPIDRSILVRGLVRDKMSALTLLAAPTPSPLKPQHLITPFAFTGKRPVSDIFASVLSNTLARAPEPGAEAESQQLKTYEIHKYDLQLRRYALELLNEKLIKPGLSLKALELLGLEILSEKTPEYQKDLTFRKSIALLFFDRFYQPALLGELSQSPEVDRDKLFVLKKENQSNPEVLSAFSSATSLNRYYRAPLTMATYGLPTATGLLVRDNLNLTEDRLAAAEETFQTLNKDFFGPIPKNTKVLSSMYELTMIMDSMKPYIEQERLFLEEIFLVISRKLAGH